MNDYTPIDRDRGPAYIGYTKEEIKNKKGKVIGSDFPDELTVRLQFDARYGAQPEKIEIVTANLMLVGPVPELSIEERFDFEDRDDD